MNKKIIIVSCGIGMLVGIIGSSVFYGNITKNTMQMSGLQLRARWAERAYQAYKNEDVKIAIWALKNLAEILQEHEKFINDKEDVQIDLVLTYGRLAILYKTLKNDIAYKENILKATNVARKANSEIKTEEDILNFLKRIDDK